MVVGRRTAKATAVVKVAGPVVVLAEEARAEARAEARVARVARVARAARAAAARLRRHLSPEGAQRTCGLQGSAFGRVLWPHPSLLWEEEQLCDAGGSPAASAEWRATHGQWHPSDRPRRRALVAKDGPLDGAGELLESNLRLGHGLVAKVSCRGRWLARYQDERVHHLAADLLEEHAATRVIQDRRDLGEQRGLTRCGLWTTHVRTERRLRELPEAHGRADDEAAREREAHHG